MTRRNRRRSRLLQAPPRCHQPQTWAWMRGTATRGMQRAAAADGEHWAVQDARVALGRARPPSEGADGGYGHRLACRRRIWLSLDTNGCRYASKPGRGLRIRASLGVPASLRPYQGTGHHFGIGQNPALSPMIIKLASWPGSARLGTGPTQAMRGYPRAVCLRSVPITPASPQAAPAVRPGLQPS